MPRRKVIASPALRNAPRSTDTNMTVSQLIERLRRHDPDAEVYVETRQCRNGTKEELTSVRKLCERELSDEGIESGVVLE